MILGHSNKDSFQDNIISDRLSIKNTSKLIELKIENSDNKFEDETNIFRGKSTEDMDQESVEFQLNNTYKLAKFNASIGKELVHSKIDFIYKKIFDKNSRFLFSKPEKHDNSSLVKKRLKSNLE